MSCPPVSPSGPTPHLGTALLDLCFPPCCIACGESTRRADLGGLDLCPGCRRGLPPPLERCRACGRRWGPLPPAAAMGTDGPPGCAVCTGPLAQNDPLRWGGTPRHLARRAVRGVVAAWSYGGVPRDLVVALKFHGRPVAGQPLILGLADALRRADIPGDLVTHVPLSRRRRRQRGYDQAALLSRGVARLLGVEHAGRALRRRRHTAPQSRMARSVRRRALRGAFVARSRAVRGRCVILVDDVLTSGATAKACALALRRGGAASVVVAVACRAERMRR